MKKIFLIFFVFSYTNSFSQNVLEGYVYDEKGKLPMVRVFEEYSNKWTFSDDEGRFKMEIPDKFIVTFSLFGKEDFILKSTEKRETTDLKIKLKDKTLQLKEVVVIAAPRKNVSGSTIVLDKYAISQFQSFSLGDVLLQLPGKSIETPSLNTPNILNLRTAINSDNNAYGVSFIVDGLPLSNDENMQTYGYGGNGRNLRTTSFSSVNSGFDLRSIPVSNIEKVEVITGVPDAEYGNTTSGVVIVKQKAGVYPLQITAKMLGGGNSISFTKGFKLPKRIGNLSLSIDYLNANADPRNNLSEYNRLTFNSIWSHYHKEEFNNTLSLTMRSNIDGAKEDKELKPGYRNSQHKKDYGITLSNRSLWQLSNKLIDKINFTIGFSYSKSDDYEEKFINKGGEVVPLAIETSIYEGLYTPVAFVSKMQTIGKPLNVNSNFSLSKTIIKKQTSHLISFGGDFNYSNNLGEGIIFDSKSANTIGTISNISTSQQGVRPLNFNRYVIPSKQFNVYFQDNFTLELPNKNVFRTNIGVRYENQNGFSTVSPRINSSYEFSPLVTLRGAVGLSTKAPSLSNIFPGHVYFDILLKDLRTQDYALNVIQTFFHERSKVNLKPMKSWKYEIGADFYFKSGQLNLTAYLNKTFDGFVNQTIYNLYSIPRLQFSASHEPDVKPNYHIIGQEEIIRSYSSATNAQNYTDKGIEFILRFNKIKQINTQFSLMGSYVYSESLNKLPYIEKTHNPLQKEFLYGFYNRVATKRDKMSLRLTVTHHINPLALLISLTAEQFILSRDYAEMENIYPYGYMNNKLEYKEIAVNERINPKYSDLFLSKVATEDVKVPTYHNFHIRVTKEMLNGLSISLYANNFLDYHPKVRVNQQYHYKNSEISFGGNIRFSF